MLDHFNAILQIPITLEHVLKRTACEINYDTLPQSSMKNACDQRTVLTDRVGWLVNNFGVFDF